MCDGSLNINSFAALLPHQLPQLLILNPHPTILHLHIADIHGNVVNKLLLHRAHQAVYQLID